VRRLTFDWRHGFQIERHSIDKMDLWGRGKDIGDPVHAGVLVSQESALRFSAVWRCIELISGTLAGLPAEVVRKRDGIREPVDRGPRWLEFPNPETNWYEFSERIFESLLMDGNAFINITARDVLGFPQELWTLHPRQTDVRRENGTTFFLWEGNTRLSKFGPTNPTGDVLHIKLRTAGGLRGMSPIEAAKQAIGLGLVGEKFGSRFFGSGQQMSGVIQLPADQPARSREHIELMRATWENTHAGSDKAHRPAILTGGATWQGITIPPEDAQFLETRAFQIEDICRFYGVPPFMVGQTEKQTSWGTGVEEQGIQFYRQVLKAHMTRFETAMSSLLPRGNFLRLNHRALIEADSKTETDVLQTQLQNGVITFNEWRAILDKPPRPAGNRYMIPLNMQILDPSGKPPEPEPAPEISPNGNGQVPADAVAR
jgi:HK97 family phage portal protein